MSYEIPLNGMILSGQPIGEYDRRLVILTKERGKISCFAKGARKPNSPILGNSRSFVFGTFFLYEGRNSYSLHSAQISNYFEDIIKDYDATLYACYFAEIADYYGREGIEAKDQLNLIYMAFCALADERLDKDTIKSVFEIRAIVMSGECPPPESVYPAYNGNEFLEKMFLYISRCPMEKVFKFTLGEDGKETLKKFSDFLVSKVIDKKLRSREMIP